jgi:hypothetical protein
MIYKLLLFISFFLTFNPVSAQELAYDITVAGKNVGSMLVTKKEIAKDKVYYSAVTDVEYTLFMTTKMVYLYEAIYENDILQNAYFIYKRNNEQEEESSVERIGSSQSYLTKKDNQTLKMDGLIKKSMLHLYFTTPQSRDAVFSERFHDQVKIAKLPDDNKYMFEIPNGDKNIYEYNEEGICSKISISSAFLKFEMTLKNSLED